MKYDVKYESFIPLVDRDFVDFSVGPVGTQVGDLGDFQTFRDFLKKKSDKDSSDKVSFTTVLFLIQNSPIFKTKF